MFKLCMSDMVQWESDTPDGTEGPPDEYIMQNPDLVKDGTVDGNARLYISQDLVGEDVRVAVKRVGDSSKTGEGSA